MKTTKVLKLQILFFCMLCVLCFTTSCRNETDIVLPDSDEQLDSLLEIRFENDTAYISADVLNNNPAYEESCDLLKNGDFALTYTWPYQTAAIKARNTEEFQFDHPEAPEMTFTHASGKFYDAVLHVSVNYMKGATLKKASASKHFVAVVTD